MNALSDVAAAISHHTTKTETPNRPIPVILTIIDDIEVN